ncbi:MAG: hypothetical protein LBR75_04850 [Prevotellaceae bacterium]|jgi:hypothetical protein|nr:hypothetical protein [Prevotellaceae bacterium]
MNDKWYNIFIETLRKIYPKNKELTDALMNLLCLEREAVYRRLRKDVAFTATEIVQIVTAWHISFDDIVEKHPNGISFKGYLLDYLNPSAEDSDMMQTTVLMLEHIKKFPDLEYLEISNKIPRILYTGYPHLNRFSLLKWRYQYADEKTITFDQSVYLPEIAKHSLEYHESAKKLSNVNFVWDNKLFETLVSDILYFHSIYLITDAEKAMIKKELLDLLNYLSEIAIKGSWPENNNKVNLYISQLNIDTNYNYFYYSGKVQLCCVQIFGKNELYSTNSAVLGDFRTWMQSKKKSSVLISAANEKSRIEFFIRQRALVNTL